jgi:CHAT domain-containing protein
MGISRKYEDGLDPLPKVVGELEGIVKDPAVEGARGVLPGTILLDKQFTEKALEQQLDARPAVVHIASHFHLEPGDDQQSYLLLAGKNEGGDGYHLTVAEFRNDQNLDLEGADLLTLSACQTGMSSNRASNGEEVDGLGGVAQEKGAKAVISSLWEVNDASTGELMADFYQRWVDGAGKVMKVEALRQAQLDLLQGRIKPSPDYTDPNAPSSFAHPHYWAPFILTGNWR